MYRPWQVEFDTRLDLAPYMSDRRGSAQPYELFGVLVHAGHSVHSGHYYCFVRAANGLWHQFDDHQVKQVGHRSHNLYPVVSVVNQRRPEVCLHSIVFTYSTSTCGNWRVC